MCRWSSQSTHPEGPDAILVPCAIKQPIRQVLGLLLMSASQHTAGQLLVQYFCQAYDKSSENFKCRGCCMSGQHIVVVGLAVVLNVVCLPLEANGQVDHQDIVLLQAPAGQHKALWHLVECAALHGHSSTLTCWLPLP